LNKIFIFLKKLPFIKEDNAFAQLIRTYIVGGVNLIFGLLVGYIFQFFIFSKIEIPLRTYLTNIGTLSIGVIISYFLSRKIIFKLSSKNGNLKEFISFVITNLINLIFPLLIWYVIDIYKPEIQENELLFLLATVLISGIILPIKYLIYKFFVFKDSLES
jgi:putative flippase GtrA